jgi:hypothetical protein
MVRGSAATASRIDSADAQACGIHLWLLVEALEEVPSAPQPQVALEEVRRLLARHLNAVGVDPATLDLGLRRTDLEGLVAGLGAPDPRDGPWSG